MDKQLCAQTARALAAIDIRDENRQLDEISNRRAQIAAAIDRTEARIADINHQLSEAARAASGVDVAARLLAGADFAEAAAGAVTNDTLKEEKDNLALGLRELRGRLRQCEDDASEVKAAAFSHLQEPLAPIIASIVEEATAAAEVIATAHAALAAITSASRCGSYEENRLGQATARLMSNGGLLPMRMQSAVPAEILTMLAELQGKGPALPASAPTHVIVPDDRAVAYAIGACVTARA